MSYQAIVSRVSVRPHPNADRLNLATCCGFQVVVGKDVEDGTLGVFFPADGQLSEAMVLANSLYSEAARVKLGLGPAPTYGFFSEKRRVRAQSFRGSKSEGLWMPLSALSWTGRQSGFTEGETFDTVNGHEVCRKYFTPATLRAQAKGPGKARRENHCFPKHDDTKQFRYVSKTIPDDAVCWITEKLHGTSGRCGRVRDDVDLARWKRAINMVIRAVGGQDVFPTTVWSVLNGSKNVILEKSNGPGYYGSHDFRYRAVEGLTPHKGEVLYFELVGWVNEVSHIMPPHPVKDELKDIKKTYGDTMSYEYGVNHGQVALYVYKITWVNEDGVVRDLSWPAVKARCGELGLKHVPELAGPFVYDNERVIPLVESLTEGPSTIDPTHIREGVVLRAESQGGIAYIKNKSWVFGVLEGYIKDLDTYIDTEESS